MDGKAVGSLTLWLAIFLLHSYLANHLARNFTYSLGVALSGNTGESKATRDVGLVGVLCASSHELPSCWWQTPQIFNALHNTAENVEG